MVNSIESFFKIEKGNKSEFRNLSDGSNGENMVKNKPFLNETFLIFMNNFGK